MLMSGQVEYRGMLTNVYNRCAWDKLSIHGMHNNGHNLWLLIHGLRGVQCLTLADSMGNMVWNRFGFLMHVNAFSAHKCDLNFMLLLVSGWAHVLTTACELS